MRCEPWDSWCPGWCKYGSLVSQFPMGPRHTGSPLRTQVPPEITYSDLGVRDLSSLHLGVCAPLRPGVSSEQRCPARSVHNALSNGWPQVEGDGCRPQDQAGVSLAFGHIPGHLDPHSRAFQYLVGLGAADTTPFSFLFVGSLASAPSGHPCGYLAPGGAHTWCRSHLLQVLVLHQRTYAEVCPVFWQV